jgi:hypothetical protein
VSKEKVEILFSPVIKNEVIPEKKEESNQTENKTQIIQVRKNLPPGIPLSEVYGNMVRVNMIYNLLFRIIKLFLLFIK